MPPLRGEGATCLVFRCTHSPYENEMRPQLDSRPRLLTTRTNSGTERPEIDGKGSPSPPLAAYLLVFVARSEVKTVVRRKNRSHPYVVIRELLSSASLLDLAPLAEIA